MDSNSVCHQFLVLNSWSPACISAESWSYKCGNDTYDTCNFLKLDCFYVYVHVWSSLCEMLRDPDKDVRYHETVIKGICEHLTWAWRTELGCSAEQHVLWSAKPLFPISKAYIFLIELFLYVQPLTKRESNLFNATIYKIFHVPQYYSRYYSRSKSLFHIEN